MNQYRLFSRIFFLKVGQQPTFQVSEETVFLQSTCTYAYIVTAVKPRLHYWTIKKSIYLFKGYDVRSYAYTTSVHQGIIEVRDLQQSFSILDIQGGRKSRTKLINQLGLIRSYV